MTKLKMFELKNCPHCHLAHSLLSELLKEEKYSAIQMEYIDEEQEAELADQYDYYYVPSFFVGDCKLAEGHVEEEDVRRVLDEALKML